MVIHHANGQELLAHAAEMLEKSEAENGVILGLAAASSSATNGMWVSVGSPPIAVAVRTPPFNLALSRCESKEALEALVNDLRARRDDPPGVTAPAETALAFAELWAAAAGKRYRVAMRQGIYELRRVVSPAHGRRARGRLRTAALADVPSIVEWMGAFAGEAALPASEMRVYQERAIKMVDDETLFVWEDDDGALVCMAFLQGKTRHGVRVSMVYTPTTQRGRGYATTFVADLSTHVLATGRSFCMLYADLANPTSNAIYQRVGYELVCESTTIEFF